jgi:hypothetical protein
VHRGRQWLGSVDSRAHRAKSKKQTTISIQQISEKSSSGDLADVTQTVCAGLCMRGPKHHYILEEPAVHLSVA